MIVHVIIKDFPVKLKKVWGLSQLKRLAVVSQEEIVVNLKKYDWIYNSIEIIIIIIIM